MQIRTIFAFFAVAAMALTMSACGGPQYPACETDDNCKEKGEYCVNKQCQQCRDDSHCSDNEECKSGRCDERPECTTDGDCPEGKVCRLDKCIEVDCTDDSDCAEGQSCSNDECVDAGCTTDQECGAGMKCEAGECVAAGNQISSACQPLDASDTVKLQTVNFDFNKSDLTFDARSTLDQNAECLREAPGISIVLEGHCDERGTQEFNLALGERRANAVQSYLRNLGIDTSKIRVVSKGKNEPVCRQATESCWERNRRVEFIQKRGTF